MNAAPDLPGTLPGLIPRERIRDIKASVDAMVASSQVSDWWWVDVQMAMPVFAKLGVIGLQDPRYFEKMHASSVAAP